MEHDNYWGNKKGPAPEVAHEPPSPDNLPYRSGSVWVDPMKTGLLTRSLPVTEAHPKKVSVSSGMDTEQLLLLTLAILLAQGGARPELILALLYLAL